MTAHRDPEERIEEIVSAALDVIDEAGLTGLTMEAVVARTSLSKGGVYRFFGSRQELLQEVYRRLVSAFQPVSMEEALGWNLPLKETLMALLFSPFEREDGLRYRRAHMRLMPELPLDDETTIAFRGMLEQIQAHYEDIIFAIVKRDRLPTRQGYRTTIRSALRIGQSLFDGLMMNSLGGMPESELRARMGTFLDLVQAATIRADT